MKYFMHFGSEGEFLGRFTDQSSNIPDGAIEISEELFWQTINETDGIWKRDPDTGEISKHPLPPAPPYVPQQVTRAQGKAVLIQAGLWQDVLDYAAGITDPTERQLAEVALHDTTHWQRTSPFLNAAAAVLGLTNEQLDGLFNEASQISL